MNPLRLQLQNVRTFEQLDLQIPAGLVSVQGSNGAGKSTVVSAIDIALFGPESRTLADLLTEDGGSTEMWLELTFEHGGAEYRARRHYSARGGGKSSFDLEHMADGWHPLTRESQRETQAELERLLGLNRETFRASTFLAQGDSAAFTEAGAAQRKAILAKILGLAVWEDLLERCRSDKRACERNLDEVAGRMRLLEERTAELGEMAKGLREAEEAAVDQGVLAEAAEANLAEAGERVQRLEREEAMWQTRATAHTTAQARLLDQQRLEVEALEARTIAETTRQELELLPEAWQIEELERHEQELRESLEDYRLAASRRAEAQAAHALAEAKRDSLVRSALERREEAERLAGQIASLLDGSGALVCEVCGQVLTSEARDETLRQLSTKHAALHVEIVRLTAEAEALVLPEVPLALKPLLRDGVPAEGALESVRHRLIGLRVEYGKRATLEERLRAAESRSKQIESEEYRHELQARERALSEAAAALAEVGEPEPGALGNARMQLGTAKTLLADARLAQEGAKAQVARLSERLQQAEQDAELLRQAKAEHQSLQGERDDLAELEKAYGRDGIPSLIVEQAAIPAIEAEANRILIELGTSYRVELRTEKMLKSGEGTRDTLEIIVAGEWGERDYSTFSGGERSRINLALRLGLARLLAHRRGAESKVLVLDEIEYLDEEGHLRLAEVLRGLQGEYEKILVCSHAAVLRDAFDNALVVRREGNRSFLEAA